MNSEHIRELLPIGSVVLLEGAQKKLLIYGICQSEQGTNKEYDYIGVLYPEGNMSAEMQFMFNHSDIQSVIFRGYSDAERDTFVDNLVKYYEQNEPLQ